MKILKQIVPLLILGLILSGGDAFAQKKKTKEKGKEEIEINLILEQEEKLEAEEKAIEKLLMKAEYKDYKSQKEVDEKLKAISERQQGLQEIAMEKYHVIKNMDGKFESIEEISMPYFEVSDIADNYQMVASPFRPKESSSLTIRKHIADLTFSAKFKYNVQEGSNKFNFVANGSVNEGAITIKLVNPKGKTIHEFEVSPLADVNWSQNFVWDDENAKKNTGTWTIIVSAKNATGKYSVSVRAN